MQNLIKILTIIFLDALVFSMPASAAGLWEPATIKRISVDANGIAFLELDPGAPNAGHVKAACSINGFWEAAFDATTPAGQALLSLALSANLSKKPVRVVGSGTCPAFGSIEGVSYLDILPE